MSLNFWRFASTLEKDFGVSYDRDSEVVACPECHEFIENEKFELINYTDGIDEGNLVFKCPICQKILTSVPFVE